MTTTHLFAQEYTNYCSLELWLSGALCPGVLHHHQKNQQNDVFAELENAPIRMIPKRQSGIHTVIATSGIKGIKR